MKGFIRLEYGKNTCGLTAFLSFVTTNVYNPSTPIAQPSAKPNISPTSTGKPTSPTKAPSKSLKAETHKMPVPFPAPSAMSKQSVLRSDAYYYLNQYVPPAVQFSGNVPVHYYSSHVLHYYSPKPSSETANFRYYGTFEPTLTHYPSSKTLGRFGYSNEATPKPSQLPLVYYGDFHTIHTPTVTPTSGVDNSFSVLTFSVRMNRFSELYFLIAYSNARI